MIHIIYRGLGFLVFLITCLSSLAVNLLVDAVGGKGYWDSHAWPLASALMAAAIVIGAIGMYLASLPTRNLVDEQTGERVVLSKKHDFFFIPMKWWGPILFGIGLLTLLLHKAPGPA
jgi:hypothetical protein